MGEVVTGQGVRVVARTANGKLGRRVAATYVARQSCPVGCVLWSVCYGARGYCGMIERRLAREAAAVNASPLDLARLEAEGLRWLGGASGVRLHVLGDAIGPECVELVAGAAAGWAAVHGAPVWSYTRGWREVDAGLWNRSPWVRVRASCANLGELLEATARGWRVALTGRNIEPKIAAAGGFRCPHETGKVPDCISCGLCWTSPRPVGFELRHLPKG